MGVLKEHGEKLVFALVIILCIAGYVLTSENEPPAIKEISVSADKISSKLGEQPSPNYKYSAAAAKELKYADKAATNWKRAERELPTPVSQHVSYPQPARPKVDPNIKPERIKEGKTEHEWARMGDVSEVKTEADHGVIYLSFRLPKATENNFMEFVRADIYRDENEKVSTKEPYDTIVLGPEEAPEAPAAAPAATARPGAAAEAPKTPEVSSGELRRREGAGAATAAAAETAAPKAAEVPKEMKDTRVYKDTNVEPQIRYFYQIQLVGRMTVADGETIPEGKNAEGEPEKFRVIQAPREDDMKKAVSTEENSKALLFAKPLAPAAPVSAIAPPNFEFRLAGVIGDPTPTATGPATDYKGSFAIRVWINELQDWKTDQIEVAPGDLLKGAVRYATPESTEKKSFDYDTGMKLVEIKIVEIKTKIKKSQPKIGPNGDPVTKNGEIEMEDVEVDVTQPPGPVAVLEELATKKLFEFPRQRDFGGSKDRVKILNTLAAQGEPQKAGGPLKSKLAGASGGAQDLLGRLRDDLTAIVAQYPGEKVKVLRDEHVRDVNQTFTKAMATATVQEGKSVDNAMTALMENLNAPRGMLRTAKAKPERTIYSTAAVLVFKKEVAKAADLKAQRAMQQAFDWLLEELTKIRTNSELAPELKTMVLTNLSTTFAEMLKATTVPEGTNVLDQLEENMKKVRDIFPTSSPDLQKKNQPYFTAADAAARALKQRAQRK